MQDFKDVLSELDTLVTKITSSERSKNNFTSMLDEQLNSINSSLSMLEQVDVKLSHMIAGFVSKLKACNDDLAAEKIQKKEYEMQREALKTEIVMMKINAEIASAQTADEREALIAGHEKDIERVIVEANSNLQALGEESDERLAEKQKLETELQLERDNIERLKVQADDALEKLGNELTSQVSKKDEMIAAQKSLHDALEVDLQKSKEKIMKTEEKLRETKLDIQNAQTEKELLIAQKKTNEEQIQKLNEVSAMTQEELETFKTKNKQDLTSAKEQMDTLNEKIKMLEIDLGEKNKTLTDGVEAIRRIITMLQQFVTDDDSAGTSIMSKDVEIKEKIKKQMEVIRQIEVKLDSSGLGETTTEFTENPINAASSVPPSPELLQQEDTPTTRPPQLEQFKNPNPLSSRQSTRKNKSQRKVTNVGALGDIGDDPNIISHPSGGTRKRKRRRSRKTRKSTKRKRNQKKRKATRRKRRKQAGGYTYKTSV
jgi:hypothetical protein